MRSKISAKSFFDGDISEKIELGGVYDFDMRVLEEQKVYISVEDSKGLKTEVVKKLTVIDDTKPSLYTPEDRILVRVNKETLLEGVKAFDNYSGDLRDRVKIDSTGVDKEMSGVYTIKYSVEDESGNKSEKTESIVFINHQWMNTLNGWSVEYIGSAFSDRIENKEYYYNYAVDSTRREVIYYDKFMNVISVEKVSAENGIDFPLKSRYSADASYGKTFIHIQLFVANLNESGINPFNYTDNNEIKAELVIESEIFVYSPYRTNIDSTWQSKTADFETSDIRTLVFEIPKEHKESTDKIYLRLYLPSKPSIEIYFLVR